MDYGSLNDDSQLENSRALINNMDSDVKMRLKESETPKGERLLDEAFTSNRLNELTPTPNHNRVGSFNGGGADAKTGITK